MTADLQDLLAPRSMAVLMLAGMRVSGLLLVAPLFSARAVPMRIRTAVLLVLVIVLHPVALAHSVVDPSVTPGSAMAEALIGVAIGLGAAVFVGAAQTAGDVMAIQTGLSGAAALDPMTRISVPVFGQLAQLLTLTLMLAANAHLVMIDALATSLQRFPIGGVVDMRGGMAALLGLGSTLFALGIRFAAPVMAAMLIANVVLAIMGRVTPQLNVLTVAFPVQIGLGLFVLAGALPFMVARFANWSADFDAVLTPLFAAFAGGR